MAQPSPLSQAVDARLLAGLHALDVVARAVIDGLNAGAHRSPFKGHSVDFADHRPYVPGDDLRHLDWKVLGRSDRLVLKRYEAETDFGCTLAVDGSASMAYRGSRAPWTKYRCACVLAAAIAYLVHHQQDRVGLQLFADGLVHERPPRRQGAFDGVCHDLEQHDPAGNTDLGKGLERLGAPSTRRGLIVPFSDLLDETKLLARTLDRLRHRGHDVAVIWLLDPDELDLGLPSVSRFQGLEGGGELVAEPKALRAAYAAVVDEHRLALRQLCRARRVALVEARSDDPPQHALNRLLVELQRG